MYLALFTAEFIPNGSFFLKIYAILFFFFKSDLRLAINKQPPILIIHILWQKNGKGKKFPPSVTVPYHMNDLSVLTTTSK